jgi:hypothetical protein
MKYFEALSMYQDFCVSMQYAELKKQTNEEALKETAGKYTFKQILDCFEALLNELDELLRIINSEMRRVAKRRKRQQRFNFEEAKREKGD